MSPNNPPSDQAVRDRILADLGKTLFVEAGSGTGKTTSLVGRIISLICGPEQVPIGQIAAITFTDKAASELRNRVRGEINQKLAATVATGNQSEIETLRSALEGLDGAAISTLHSFARRLLDEHPLEAGLPPGFQTLDEFQGQEEYDAQWAVFVEGLLKAEKDSDWLQVLNVSGVFLEDLGGVAKKFIENWDLLKWSPPEEATTQADVDRWVLRDLLKHAEYLIASFPKCSNPDDLLYKRLVDLPDLPKELKACSTDSERLLMLASDKYKLPKRGNKTNWAKVDFDKVKSSRDSFINLRHELIQSFCSQAVSTCAEHLREFALGVVASRRQQGVLGFHDLLVMCRDLLLSPEYGKTVRKSLHKRYTHLLLDEFHDTDPIQIEIATLIASPVSGSAADLAKGWQTQAAKPGQLFFVGDPKQSIYRFRRADIKLYHEALGRFGSQIGETLNLNVNFRSTTSIIDWVNAVFEELMSVDPEAPASNLQASYAPLVAVRADLQPGPTVAVLGSAAHEEAKTEEISQVEATEIAATIHKICAEGWQIKDRLTGDERPAALDDITILLPTRTSLRYLEEGLYDNQIPYRLDAVSFVWATSGIRDILMCLRAAADPTDDLAIVSALRTPIYGCGDDDLFGYAQRNHQNWDYRKPDPDASGSDCPVAAGLEHLNKLHRRASFETPATLIELLVSERQVLEQATAWPGVRSEWRHIRFLVDQARAWSENQQSGLRSFLQWARSQSEAESRVSEPALPETDDSAVSVMTMHASKGLEFPIVILAGLRETVKKTVKKPGGQEVGFDRGGLPPEIRLGSLDGLGLEIKVKVKDSLRKIGFETLGFGDWAEAEKEAQHYERVRKLYVACTRARDHLVMSLHRNAPNASSDANTTSAELLFVANQNAPQDVRAEELDVAEYKGKLLPREFLPPAARKSKRPNYEDWVRQHEAALGRSRQPAWLGATRLAKSGAAFSGDVASSTDQGNASSFGQAEQSVQVNSDFRAGLDKEPIESAEDSSRRGRYGTSFGSAVHGVLQQLDLATAIAAVAGSTGSTSGSGSARSAEFNDQLERLARAQAAAEGVGDQADEVVSRVRVALASETIARAAESRHWKEVYVGVPVPSAGDTAASEAVSDYAEVVLDGYIDLLYEASANSEEQDLRSTASESEPPLVVLDYKTANTTDEAELKRRTDGYLMQGASYAYCVQRATSKSVVRVEFAYLTEAGVQIHTIQGEPLATAIQEVERLVQQELATATQL